MKAVQRQRRKVGGGWAGWGKMERGQSVLSCTVILESLQPIICGKVDANHNIPQPANWIS